MRIIEDDLTGAAVAALLGQHLEGMARHSPKESIHALDLRGLRAPNITVFTAWKDDELLGCGALQELDVTHGEIKSMRTANAHIERGVATAILSHLINEASKRFYERLSLETGSGPAFDPAHSLYEKFGFEFCGPFGNYEEDPFSRFMTLKLASSQ